MEEKHSTRKKQSELSFDGQTFKTTITFKGKTKELVAQLGHSKSSIINALVTDAIKSGKMSEYLTEHFTNERTKEIMNNIGVENVTRSYTKAEHRAHRQSAKEDVNEESSSFKPASANTQSNKPKGNGDGFDF